MTPATVTVPATPAFVRTASEFIVRTARHLGFEAASGPLFEVAIVEAVTNAVKHGSRGREDAVVVCEVERTDDGLRIRICDEGEGYTPPEAPAPPVGDNPDIASLPESGYGVPIIRSVFQDVQTRRRDGKFCLELTLVASLPLA